MFSRRPAAPPPGAKQTCTRGVSLLRARTEVKGHLSRTSLKLKDSWWRPRSTIHRARFLYCLATSVRDPCVFGFNAPLLRPAPGAATPP